MYLPPSSKTGVQNTKGEKMNYYAEELSNGLIVSVDYIAFTVIAPMPVSDVILLMGFVPDDFIEMPKGGFGYKKQLKNESNGISILYDGAENMGIHVNVTGRAVGSLLQAFSTTQEIVSPFNNSSAAPLNDVVLGLFFQEVLKVGQFTRLDAAIDDFGGNYLSPKEVFALYENHQVISKWRTVRINDRRCAPKVCDGYTLYFGSRESSLMLRIYDKKHEQNKKLSPDDENYVDFEWYRWELEFKEDRANQFAQKVIDGISLGCIVVGVLSFYLRFIELDDSNRSRCSTLKIWQNFIQKIEQLSLYVKKKNKSVYDKLAWIESQVMPTLTTLLMLHNFDDSFIFDLAAKNKFRISKSDWELIKKHRPDVYATYFVEE